MAGGQTLVIVNGDPNVATFDLELDDGSVLTAPIDWDEQIDWGVARFEIPEGRTIARGARGDAVQPLSEVPPTVPAGSPLQYYQ